MHVLHIAINYLQVILQPFILPFDQVNPLLQVEVQLSRETDQVDWAYVPAEQTHQKMADVRPTYKSQNYT